MQSENGTLVSDETKPERSPSRRKSEGRRLIDKATYYGKAIGLIVAASVYFGVEAYDKRVARKEDDAVRELVQKNKDEHIRLLQEQIEALKKQAK